MEKEKFFHFDKITIIAGIIAFSMLVPSPLTSIFPPVNGMLANIYFAFMIVAFCTFGAGLGGLFDFIKDGELAEMIEDYRFWRDFLRDFPNAF